MLFVTVTPALWIKSLCEFSGDQRQGMLRGLGDSFSLWAGSLREIKHPAGSFRLPSPGVTLSHLRNTEELPQNASPRGISSSSGQDLSSPLYLSTLRLEKLQAALTRSLVSNCLETCSSQLILWCTEPYLLSST